MKEDPKLNSTIHYTIETAIRLGFLILLLAWCFQILYPFAGVIIWGVILALASAPLYDTLNAKLGDKPKLASAIIIISGLMIILIPSWLFLDSMVTGVKEINKSLNDGTLTIPPPSEKVAEWPVVGDMIYDTWKLASDNLEHAIIKYKDQITDVVGTLLEGVLSMGGSVLQFIFATIIAGILLATKGTDSTARKFFKKLVGARGDEFTDVTETIVRNVTKGVIGVALIQSVLVGLGFLLAGVPYAGLWALLVLILAILQLPPLLVILPIVLYLFSTTTVLPATLWTVYLLLAGASDNILKPILLGKGAPVPMLVIFLGVIGGFMLSGFIGLFTGAIVISLGYKMFLTWLNDTEDNIETDN
ncbi:MAG: AI-2E family transporter [Cyclobacteriaceae bacterium]|nr:AI-2E family transporter [Cyclobacteriaceae bacterium]MCK5207751.1 AI-2E family transporter [Cyclobacteriaceae bacterium]